MRVVLSCRHDDNKHEHDPLRKLQTRTRPATLRHEHDTDPFTTRTTSGQNDTITTHIWHDTITTL